MLKSEIDDGLDSTVKIILRLYKKLCAAHALDDGNKDDSINNN